MSFVNSRTAKVATPAAQGERYEPAVGFVVTGVMAAGKSTVAELLGQRFERGVHRARRRLSKDDRAWSRPDHTRARRRGASSTRPSSAHRGSVANDYWRDDFTVVLQDIYAGDALANVVGRLEISPLYVVVLNPRPERRRDARTTAREVRLRRVGYRGSMRIILEETSHIGLWLDTSELSPRRPLRRFFIAVTTHEFASAISPPRRTRPRPALRRAVFS